MTSRDFLAAAKIVRGHKYPLAIAQAIENSFIELFQQDNSHFDETRFRAACKKENPLHAFYQE